MHAKQACGPWQKTTLYAFFLIPEFFLGTINFRHQFQFSFRYFQHFQIVVPVQKSTINFKFFEALKLRNTFSFIGNTIRWRAVGPTARKLERELAAFLQLEQLVQQTWGWIERDGKVQLQKRTILI
jgi:hypothetical protein